MAIAITIAATGTPVDCMPTDNPSISKVAGLVTACSAMLLVGLWACEADSAKRLGGFGAAGTIARQGGVRRATRQTGRDVCWIPPPVSDRPGCRGAADGRSRRASSARNAGRMLQRSLPRR